MNDDVSSDRGCSGIKPWASGAREERRAAHAAVHAERTLISSCWRFSSISSEEIDEWRRLGDAEDGFLCKAAFAFS